MSFYAEIRTAISDFNAEHQLDSSLNFSECFLTIANELQLMKNKSGERNVLLVFSDLQENSNLFSCYTKANQELLYESPDTISQIFESMHLLPKNLNSIKVIFIFQPLTRPQDQKFEAMVKIYRKLLESRGATVIVQANNTYFN